MLIISIKALIINVKTILLLINNRLLKIYNSFYNRAINYYIITSSIIIAYFYNMF